MSELDKQIIEILQATKNVEVHGGVAHYGWQIPQATALLKQAIEALLVEARREEITQANVGKISYAQRAAKKSRATTKQGAFLEGFRTARNVLQEHKSERLSQLTAPTGEAE